MAQRMNTRLAAQLRSEADLHRIAARQADFVAAVASGQHLAMSDANKAFHMAIAEAGRNPHLSAFYDRLLTQGRRMLHLHFDFLERAEGGYLLTDEHDAMLEAIRARDVERADALAQAHTRQFQASFLDFIRTNFLRGVAFAPRPPGG